MQVITCRGNTTRQLMRGLRFCGVVKETQQLSWNLSLAIGKSALRLEVSGPEARKHVSLIRRYALLALRRSVFDVISPPLS
jgi:hypothetical protein